MKSELRVHGVSGTQPRDMLYTDPVLRDSALPDQPRSYTEVLEIARAEEEFDDPGIPLGRANRRKPVDRFLDPFWHRSPSPTSRGG